MWGECSKYVPGRGESIGIFDLNLSFRVIASLPFPAMGQLACSSTRKYVEDPSSSVSDFS